MARWLDQLEGLITEGFARALLGDYPRLVLGALVVLPLTVVTLAYDPYAYGAAFAPKVLSLLLLAPALWCIWIAGAWLKHRKVTLHVGVIACLLGLRAGWIVATTPNGFAWRYGDGLWLLLALFALLVLVQQFERADSSDAHDRSTLTPHHIYLRTIWLLGAAEAALGFGQVVASPSIIEQFSKTSMVGTLGSPNGYGAFMAIAVVAAFAETFSTASKALRLSSALTGVACVLALAVNGSRGGILGLSAAITIVLLLSANRYQLLSKGKPLGKVSLVFAAAVVLSLCAVLLAWVDLDSSAGRLMVWEVGFPMFSEQPLTGVGYGRVAVEYLDYQARYFSDPGRWVPSYKAADLKQIHNEYLEAFYSTGLIGGVLFASIWVIGLSRSLHLLWKRNTEDPTSAWVVRLGIASVLIVILTHALVDSPLHVLPVAVAAYIGLGLTPSVRKGVLVSLNPRWSAFLLITLASLTIWVGTMLSQQYPAHWDWLVGQRASGQANWEDASEAYERAMGKLPRKSELEFHYGAALVLSGSYTKGGYWLRSSLRGFNDKNIHLSLSLANMRLGRLEEAERYASTAAAMFPDHLAPYLLLAEVYHGQGRDAEARAALRRCIERRTHFQSHQVELIARDAERLWSRYYGSDPQGTNLKP